MSCTQPPNYVDNADDCDDGDERVYPGAPELCDGKDNDCNAATGEDALVTFDGSNYGTIQAALDAAEVAGGGTVYVCAGTYQENLTVAVDVDLIGLDGAAATILEPASGMTGTRVVTVESGLAVAIEGFTMQGVSTSADGGAILASEGGSTEVTACVITGNEAARGGGIFLADGTLTVTDSTLELNDATSDGGAIYAAGGTLIVRDNVAGSVINDNQAANGGAVAVVRSGSATSCSVSIAGTTLSGNAATVRGGALYLEGTDPGMGGATLDATVARATIGGGTSAEGNLANEGGGIAAVTSAAITLDGATAISHNQVTGAGGGVLLSGPITLAGPAAPPNAPSIDHNSSGGQAGGIDIDGLSTLSNLTVASNTATGQGGGFRITLSSGTLYLTAVRIEDNQSGNESAGEGGGITFTTGTVRMQYCEVLGNRATTGGGMALQADSMVIFDDGSVLQNGWDLATDLGGGAWIKSGQGVLAVANSDWGTGGTDNLPFDVWTVAGAVHAYTAYGAGANFTCDNQGCN